MYTYVLYVSTDTHVSWHVCGGWRSGGGVSHFPPKVPGIELRTSDLCGETLLPTESSQQLGFSGAGSHSVAQASFIFVTVLLPQPPAC